MSVVDVTKMWSRTGGTIESEKISQLDQVWSGVADGYQVLHEAGDSLEEIVTAVGIPQIGTPHPVLQNCYVKSLATEAVSPILTMVLASYKGIVNDESVKVRLSSVSSTEPVDRDWFGAPILTPNGEPVYGLTREITDTSIVISRTYYSFNSDLFEAYTQYTNSDTFLGKPPGTLRLQSWQAENAFPQNGIQQLWQVSATILRRVPYANTTNAQAWMARWRQEGLYVRDGGIIRRALDAQGQEMTRPVLLKDDGTEETDPNAAVYKHTQIYGSAPYAALGLL